MNTELELFKKELEALYNDLPRRLNIENWKVLLKSDLCQNIDKEVLVEEIFTFFIGKLPVESQLLRCLDEYFDFFGYEERLKEKFPIEYIYQLLSCTYSGERELPMELFSPGIDVKKVDECVHAYYDIVRYGKEDQETCDMLQNSEEKHPWIQALLYSKRISDGDKLALTSLQELHEQYTQEDYILELLIDAYYNDKQYDKTIEMAKKYIDSSYEYDIVNVKTLKAKSYIELKEFRKGIETIGRLVLDENKKGRFIMECITLMNEWDVQYLDYLTLKYNEGTCDDGDLCDMVYMSLKFDKLEDALNYISQVEERKPNAYMYYNAYGLLASYQKHYGEALEYYKKALETVFENKDDELNDNQKRKCGDMVLDIAKTLIQLEKPEEAKIYIDGYYDIICQNRDNLYSLFDFYYEKQLYNEADAIADIILEKDNDYAKAHYNKARVNYELGNDQIAFNEIGEAIDRYSYNLSYHGLELKLLVRHGMYEDARHKLNMLESRGVSNDFDRKPIVIYNALYDFIKIRIYFSDDKIEKTLEETDLILEGCKALDEYIENHLDLNEDWYPEFYSLYAAMISSKQFWVGDYPDEPIMEVLEKGLSLFGDNEPCLHYKGILLKKQNRIDEAIELYHKIESFANHGEYVERSLAKLYYSKEEYNVALYYYKLIAQNHKEEANNYFYIGWCLYNMEQPEEAIQYFLLEQKYAPEDIDGYYRLAHVYLKMNEVDRAIEQGLKALEIVEKYYTDEEDTKRFYEVLIMAYQKQGNASQAIDVILECAKHNPQVNANEWIAQTYMQVGSYLDAKDYLQKWFESFEEEVSESWIIEQAEYFYLTMQHEKYKKHLKQYESLLSETKKYLYWQIYALSLHDLTMYKEMADKKYQYAKEQGEIDNEALGPYAFALAVCGYKEEAKQIAKQALEKDLQEQEKYSGYRLIYTSRIVRLAKILEDEKLYEYNLEEANKLPMCWKCQFSGCKDLLVFLGQIELLKGNYQKAMEYALEGLEKYPFETSFLELQYLVETLMPQNIN